MSSARSAYDLRVSDEDWRAAHAAGERRKATEADRDAIGRIDVPMSSPEHIATKPSEDQRHWMELKVRRQEEAREENAACEKLLRR